MFFYKGIIKMSSTGHIAFIDACYKYATYLNSWFHQKIAVFNKEILRKTETNSLIAQ